MSEQLTFEQAMTRLEQIVMKLESGKCSLDESIRLFEEGTRLTGFCRQSLDTAEQKIRRLTDTAAAPAAEE